jgi:hypothetical protein
MEPLEAVISIRSRSYKGTLFMDSQSRNQREISERFFIKIPQTNIVQKQFNM